MANHNKAYVDCNKHIYNMVLNAYEAMENMLNDEQALCLDGTRYGNVGRSLNHKFHGADLVDIPVQTETTNQYVYHVRSFQYLV
jgi:hypothetical protein